MTSANPYAGRVVVVTGGAGGIGAAVARRFAGHGSRVVLADLDAERGAAVAAEVGGLFVPADVSRWADNTAIVEAALAEYGRIDLVHLNAGIIGSTTIGDRFDAGAYRRIVAINLDSVVFGVQAALPALRAAGGGAIVATASAAGLRPSIEVFYSATKSAVVQLVRSLAPLLAPDGITVNAICPGLVDTPLIDSRRAAVAAAGIPVAAAELVVDAVEEAVAGGGTGEAWLVMADRPVAPFAFADLPVPGADRLRVDDGMVRVRSGDAEEVR